MSQSSPEVKQAWLNRNKHKRNDICRKSRLRREYGITPEQYQEIYDSQGGRCAICKEELVSDKKTHLDHDHRTKWVRGILCNNCNCAIGLLKDDVDVLQSAISYLVNNPTPPEFVFTKVPVPKENRVHSAERKEAQSLRQKGNKFRLGKPAWNKGTPWTEEIKEKMRKPKRKKE